MNTATYVHADVCFPCRYIDMLTDTHCNIYKCTELYIATE